MLLRMQRNGPLSLTSRKVVTYASATGESSVVVPQQTKKRVLPHPSTPFLPAYPQALEMRNLIDSSPSLFTEALFRIAETCCIYR